MLHALLRICLVVCLSLTAVTAAVARGQMAGATEIVICAGTGVTSVTLDATGKRVEAHPCPVCTAATSGASVPVAAVVVRPVTRFATVRADAGQFRQGVDGVVPVARGPPARA